MSWRSAVLFALLCPLALIGGAGGPACFNRNSSISVRAKLVEALGPCRFIEGRLTGGFSQARFDPAHPELRLSKDRRIALRKLSREASGSTPESIADRALFKLLDGDPRQAVQSLEAASAAKPNSAALLSDLAAVYLADARVNNDPYSRVKALEAAENAVTIDPNLREARFNRAMALESLFLRNQAKSAWNEYLKLDGKSGWAQEARDRKSAADVPDAASRWALQARKLEEAASRKDQATVNQIVRDFPQASREYAEEKLLGEWAAAALAQRIPEAQQKLAEFRSIGAALVVANGERMVAATVETIERTISSRELSRLTRLESGHDSYRMGMESYAQGRFAEAREHFVRAHELLSRGGSPFVLWAAFRLAVSEMQLFHYGRALMLLDQVRGTGFLSLKGRASWVAGLIYGIQAKPAESIESYLGALNYFTANHEAENFSVVSSLVAECLRNLGDLPNAWESHLRALGRSDLLRDPARRQLILEQAGTTALQGEYPSAALAFLEEALGEGSPPLITASFYSLRQKAVAHGRRKQIREAAEDLRKARLIAGQFTDEAARMSAFGDLLATEANILAQENPSKSLTRLNLGISIYAKTSYRQQLAILFAARARAYLNLGSRVWAETDFQRAIQAVQEQRSALKDSALRESYQEEIRSIFDDMVGLQADLGRKDQALNYAELFRAEVARDLAVAAHAKPRSPFLKSAEIQARLPREVAIIEYRILAHKLLVWVVRRDSLVFFNTTISSEELRSMAERFRGEVIKKPTSSFCDKNCEEFSELLIGKLWPAIRGAETLVIVPDHYLYATPFAVLRAGPSGKLLIESHAISVVPGINSYLDALKSWHSSEAIEKTALVLGDPQYDQRSLFSLVRLRHAEGEARKIAALYSRSRLVVGREATREALLKGLNRFDVVHFAGHYVASSAAPLSSFLALSPAGNGSGILYARDLYRLRKIRARLVVLSSCSSLSGKGWSGEGVSNLARPLLAAGVSAVVGSLWQVDDRSAEDLMAAFHYYVCMGFRPAAALRRAQLKSLSRKNASAEWAGFQVIGI